MNNDSLQLNTGKWSLKQGISGNTLKMIGVVLMVFDHLHQMFMAQGAPDWFSMLGRLVLPIFLFMCAEGFHYTRSRKRYLLQLLIGFWVMGIGSWVIERVFPTAHTENPIMLTNNVFSTMFLVVLYLLIIEFFKTGIREKKPRKIACGALLLLAPIAYAVVVFLLISVPVIGTISYMFVPNLLTNEGGFFCVLLGIAFYLLRRWRWAQMAALLALSALDFSQKMGTGDIQWMMVFAIIPIMLYNGKRGGGNKYFFYAFYPLHIWVFYIIAFVLNNWNH